MAARLPSRVVFATAYHPEGKGKIERFFRTLKESFYPEARRADIQTLDELNVFFWAWLEQYHDTVHSETHQTPRERWEAGADQAEWPEPAAVVDLFLWEETRKVDKSGCVRMDGNAYPVVEYLVNQKVSVRFDPFDLSSIRVHHKGKLVCTARASGVGIENVSQSPTPSSGNTCSAGKFYCLPQAVVAGIPPGGRLGAVSAALPAE